MLSGWYHISLFLLAALLFGWRCLVAVRTGRKIRIAVYGPCSLALALAVIAGPLYMFIGEQSCNSRGGKWVNTIWIGCLLKTSDFGKHCNKNSDCEGVCRCNDGIDGLGAMFQPPSPIPPGTTRWCSETTDPCEAPQIREDQCTMFNC